MSQIVYTELEAFPLRWPYLQLEPLDNPTTKTWPSDQTFNTSTASTTYTPADVSSPTALAIYGSRKLGQVLKRHVVNEFWDDLKVNIRKVGVPGPLRIEVYKAVRSSDVFLADPFLEDIAGGGLETIATSWRATTRNFPAKIKISQMDFYQYITNWQIRTANSDGSPSTTVIAQGTYTYPNPVTFNPPLEIGPGLYSFIMYGSTSTANIIYNVGRVSATDFGIDHSTWVSTDSGSTWSSAGRTNYMMRLGIYPLAWVTAEKLGEWEVPASRFGNTAAYTSIMPEDGRKIFVETESRLYVVLSSPQSSDVNNCYMVQRGGTYKGASANFYLYDDTLWEHSAFFDGSTWVYKPHDLLMQKTYLTYSAVNPAYTNTYYLGPGSYAPKVSIQIKAASGTVYARPVIPSGVLVKLQPEKSTTSTIYTTLSWDVVSGVPEIIESSSNPIRFLVRGNGAYNQTSYEPRIYYNKNPVTPRDFGFTELYLMRIRAEVADTLVRVNDKTNMYFATAGDSVVIDPNFKAPITKLYVLKGRVTVDLLGVV